MKRFHIESIIYQYPALNGQINQDINKTLQILI